MTNLERTKAVVARERLGLEVMQQHGLSPGPSVPWILLNEAESLVAAVERVQALHTPAVDSELQSTYCLGCDAPWPCGTRKALETP